MNSISLDDQGFVSARTITTPVTPVTPAKRKLPETEGPQPEKPVASGEPQPAQPEAPKKSPLRAVVVVLALLVVAIGVGFYYLQFVAPFESTDDAFIDAHVTPIAPQISGRVSRILVRDNQEVKAGETILEIDPSDYQVKLDQAVANLAAAQSRIEQVKAQSTVDEAKLGEAKANVVAVESEAKRAEADFKRYQAVGTQGVSVSQLDLAGTRSRSTSAQVDVANNQELAAEAQLKLDQANLQTAQAEVQMSEAQVRQAKLNLSYTQVIAPEAGFVTHRTVEAGAYVEAGQALLAVVPRQVWVTANFKETQLAHMQAGQPVTVTVDAYPRIKFKGHVDSIQAGAGARFSLMPPENASGNYVKVVQRVPVKIVLDEVPDSKYVLGPGMSVVPEVRIQ